MLNQYINKITPPNLSSKLNNEPFLEPILRKFRLRRVLPCLRQIQDCHLLDIGCGWKAELLRAAEPYIASGVGIDFKAPDLQDPKLQTISVTLDSTLPFDDDCFDVVTLMAVLEHLQNPDAILREARRVLKKGKGILLGTVPSKWGKPVLEFLAYTAGIVNPDEILDHKQYFDKASLTAILREAGFNDIRHKYFQLGMNNFWIARA